MKTKVIWTATRVWRRDLQPGQLGHDQKMTRAALKDDHSANLKTMYYSSSVQEQDSLDKTRMQASHPRMVEVTCAHQQPVASWHLGRTTIGGACSACSHVYPLGSLGLGTVFALSRVAARYSPRLVLALPFLLHIYPTPTHDRALPQCTLLTILPVFLCPASPHPVCFCT
ncbi:hypothetical protein BDZ85DRAFT_256497 [Elsinoe ampelina]|uniref:Uncharacterized protein n=1 Tax=Elsinoe ampelina TaxID=302913 RepID=A0A6A6GM34_9PEZI|nr:hypothetical protein BDZ85DRAFT_256497 [Elsinoe ampelina]